MGSENNMVAVQTDWAKIGREYAEAALSGGIPQVASPQYALSGTFTAMAQEIEQLRARLAQPDAQQGEATVADMAAFGASDVACYLYPGEHQQAERAAFCEGAARSATPQQGASSPASGEGVEPYLSDRFEWAAPGDQQEDAWLVRFCDKDCGEAVFTGPEAEADAWAHWNRYAPSYNLYVFRLARLSTPLAAATQPAVRQEDTVAFVQEWLMSGDHEPTQWDRDFAAAIDARSMRLTDEQLTKLAERFCATPLPWSVAADLCATQQGFGRHGTNLLTVAEAKEMLSAAFTGAGENGEQGA